MDMLPEDIIMDMLPEDVIIDIFSRLPAKSIGKSRCVSKPWKSLLTQPQIIQNHIKKTQQFKSSQESLILVSNDSRSLYSVQFNNAHQVFDEMTVVATKLNFVDHLFESAKICGTAYCDGLILVGDEKKNFSLINPTTKEIKVLPRIPYDYDNRYGYPSYGIGYDSFSEDYKVVIIFCYDTSNVDEDEEERIEEIVNVYSVKNGTWKRAASSPYFHAERYGLSGVYANGCIHWVACRPAGRSFVIAAFDLKEEKFHELVRPSAIDDNMSMRHRVNHVEMFGGCLGVHLRSKDVAEFWKMEEYGVKASWKRFAITDPDKNVLRPVCFLQEERQVVLVKYKWNASNGVVIPKLMLWDFEAKTFQNIVVDGIPGKFSVERTFMESLVSPKCSNNIHERHY